ncbi:MAG: histidinol-phosphate transaminase [Planctomycetota bacterium]
MADVTRWVRSSVRGMEVPEYGEPVDGALRLDANTNLLGPNPVLARFGRGLRSVDVAQYPSGNSDPLREALSDLWRVPVGSIVVGNGSDEIIDLCAKAFVEPGSVVAWPAPSFVMYGFSGRVHMGRTAPVPLREDWSLDVPGLLAARARLTFVASPNNPTGNRFPEGDLDRLARKTRGVVVVDEAYAEFCGQEWTRKALRYANVIAMRTLSKAYGLAGLRVGYAVARRELAEALLAVKAPFNVGGIPEAIAAVAVRDQGHVRRTVEMVTRERPRLATGLERLGFVVWPSEANFVLARSPVPTRGLLARLRKRGILLKDVGHVPGLANCVRVTVGPSRVTHRFLSTLEEVM